MIEKNFWDLTDEEFEARSYPGTLTNEEAKKMDAEISILYTVGCFK
jgi:hypothetical protein